MNPKTFLYHFLKQPYPFYYEGKKLLQILIIIFLISFFFNYLLQPFDVNSREHKMDYFYISILHSSSPLLVILCTSLTFKLFPKITDEWNIKKECTYILILILLTGLMQFLLRDIIYNNPLNWSWRYLKEEIANTFVAGLFLAPIIISININRRRSINQSNANHITSTLAEEAKKFQNNTLVTIETEVKSEKFTFETNHFIYAKAEGNYAEIFLKKGNSTQKLIKRISIKNLETQLSNFPFIIKTHRSILLNLNYIGDITGNAQGYKIKLKDCQDTVSVSRNFIKSFEQATTKH